MNTNARTFTLRNWLVLGTHMSTTEQMAQLWERLMLENASPKVKLMLRRVYGTFDNLEKVPEDRLREYGSFLTFDAEGNCLVYDVSRLAAQLHESFGQNATTWQLFFDVWNSGLSIEESIELVRTTL